MTSSGPSVDLVRSRGLARPWDPRVWGTVVGAVGATVFVWVNAAALPGAVTDAAVVLWTIGLAVYVVEVFVRPRRFAPVEPVSRWAGAVYLASVLGMLVLIRVGTAVLPDAERDDLRPAVIVVAVGLHFLPFARAFHAPVFTRLGAVMTVLGVAGLLGGLLWSPVVAAAAAVLAGLVMLALIALDARTPS